MLLLGVYSGLDSIERILSEKGDTIRRSMPRYTFPCGPFPDMTIGKKSLTTHYSRRCSFVKCIPYNIAPNNFRHSQSPVRQVYLGWRDHRPMALPYPLETSAREPRFGGGVRSRLAVKSDSVHSCTETVFIFQEILRAKSDAGASMQFDRRPMALPY
jgi:hypothetical protein